MIDDKIVHSLCDALEDCLEELEGSGRIVLERQLYGMLLLKVKSMLPEKKELNKEEGFAENWKLIEFFWENFRDELKDIFILEVDLIEPKQYKGKKISVVCKSNDVLGCKVYLQARTSELMGDINSETLSLCLGRVTKIVDFEEGKKDIVAGKVLRKLKEGEENLSDFKFAPVNLFDFKVSPANISNSAWETKPKKN